MQCIAHHRIFVRNIVPEGAMQPHLLLRGQDATTCCRSGFAVTKIKSSERISPVTHQYSAPARRYLFTVCVNNNMIPNISLWGWGCACHSLCSMSLFSHNACLVCDILAFQFSDALSTCKCHIISSCHKDFQMC